MFHGQTGGFSKLNLKHSGNTLIIMKLSAMESNQLIGIGFAFYNEKWKYLYLSHLFISKIVRHGRYTESTYLKCSRDNYWEDKNET
jgi:hypothetical protein